MEDGRPRLSSTTLARIVSIAGHPFLLSPLTVAAATRSLRWAGILAAAMILPLTAIVARNVRRGTWSDADVSRHDQRSGLYYAAAPLLAICAVALYLLGASSELLRAMAAVSVMLAAGFLANRFLKVSLHMMCAAFCCVLLARVYPWSAYATVPFALAIAWSRWKLGRHTVTEIAFGLTLGAVAAMFV
jgi:membrane-associated phospholipid phosphatase